MRCVCGKTIEEASPAKGHGFATTWSKDETNHWHASTCGHDVTADKAAHTWNSSVVTTPAKCTEAGVTTYTCTVCGATKTEPIAASGHSFAEAWSKDDTDHWHASTCGHDVTDGKAAHSYAQELCW